MIAFILATDFDFIAYMSKVGFFFFWGGGGGVWKLFLRQWRFWNMISMIFVIVHYCKET